MVRGVVVEAAGLFNVLRWSYRRVVEFAGLFMIASSPATVARNLNDVLREVKLNLMR